MVTKSYSEMLQHSTFEERFRYLSLHGSVGRETFGFDRYVNQAFYTSREWRALRFEIIARDLGCDLGVQGYEIHDQILIHHMNPIGVKHVLDRDPDILNPEYLICTTKRTHNAIHFGDESQLPRVLVERRPGDTKLW